MHDFKKKAAKSALNLVAPGSTIGFGAGATIAHLIGFINEEEALAASITVVTSSFSTKLLLEQYGFVISDTGSTSQIDLYFDGCDQFDRQLNALKSGGGIHTREKILAAMAGEFIIIGDESKYVEKLDARYPLVVEVIPEALSFASDQLKKIFAPSEARIRLSNNKDGAVITENGNFLIDLWFNNFPEPAFINDRLIYIPGVLEHSLFYNMAHKAIIAGSDGVIIK